MTAEAVVDEPGQWGRLEIRGCLITIFTRAALLDVGVRDLGHDYLLVIDTDGKVIRMLSDTIERLRVLVPILCPAHIHYCCLPGEQDDLRAIALAVHATHEYMDSVREARP